MDLPCGEIDVNHSSPTSHLHWQPEDIALVFLTCPRKPAYLPASLASALLGDPLTARLREIAVAVDAPNLSCVRHLTGHRRVRWVKHTRDENERAQSYHLHRRACHNYWRALRLAAPGARAVLVCEDDLMFRDGWLSMLLECLDEVHADGVPEFLLAAYSPRDHEEPALRRGRFYSKYFANGFYGTQAMLYPAEQLEAVSQLIWSHGVMIPEAPYDLLIQRFASERQHIYTTRHSLVQHVGAKSTGLGGGHLSPSFKRPWPLPKNGTGKLLVLTSISYDASLLPHFVAYYRQLGVEKFDIVIHELKSGIRAEVEQLVSVLGPGIDLHRASERQERTGVEGSNREDLRRLVARPEDWVIPADLDEFVQFPLPLPELIDTLKTNGAQFVMGRFSDRLAPGGILAPTKPDTDVWTQYPLEANVTSRLTKGCCTKVILCRGDCQLAGGHHSVHGPSRELRDYSGIVHHFKWRAGLKEAMERRIEIYHREKVPWVDESERVLAHLVEHGRIVPECFSAKNGWQPSPLLTPPPGLLPDGQHA